eukprot:6172729-Pleurochrysis_carterae.AAC.1
MSVALRCFMWVQSGCCCSPPVLHLRAPQRFVNHEYATHSAFRQVSEEQRELVQMLSTQREMFDAIRAPGSGREIVSSADGDRSVAAGAAAEAAAAAAAEIEALKQANCAEPVCRVESFLSPAVCVLDGPISRTHAR